MLGSSGVGDHSTIRCFTIPEADSEDFTFLFIGRDQPHDTVLGGEESLLKDVVRRCEHPWSGVNVVVVSCGQFPMESAFQDCVLHLKAVSALAKGMDHDSKE